MRVRLFLGGELVDEADPETEPVVRIAERHGALALAYPGLHLVEIEFDDGTFSRFGTDPAGMVDPRPASADPVRLAEALADVHRDPS